MILRLLSVFTAATVLVACAVAGEVEERTEAGSRTAPATSDPNVSFLLVTGVGGDVRVIEPDGTPARQMRGPTPPDHPSLQPTWSPAAKDARIPAAWTELNDDGTFSIAVGDARSPEITRYGSPVAPFYYYWSPDGSMLAFLGQSAFSPIQMGILDLRNRDGEIIGEGQPYYFDWRSDSQALVAHVGDALSMLTLADGAWRSSVLPLTPGLFQAPAWASERLVVIVSPTSPDAVQVRLPSLERAQGDTSAQRLVVSDLAGRTSWTLASLDGAAAFALDPDGERVAFTDFDGPLRVVDVAGGEDLAVSEGRVAAFQWSPDGERLLFMEVDGQAQALEPKVWDDSGVRAFVSFFPTRVFLFQYLPFWDQYSRSLTLWSPTGDAFTYPALSPDTGQAHIMVQPVDGSTPVAVSRGVFASWSPALPPTATGS